jgi:hypothetical protein
LKPIIIWQRPGQLFFPNARFFAEPVLSLGEILHFVQNDRRRAQNDNHIIGVRMENISSDPIFFKENQINRHSGHCSVKMGKNIPLICVKLFPLIPVKRLIRKIAGSKLVFDE